MHPDRARRDEWDCGQRADGYRLAGGRHEIPNHQIAWTNLAWRLTAVIIARKLDLRREGLRGWAWWVWDELGVKESILRGRRVRMRLGTWGAEQRRRIGG